MGCSPSKGKLFSKPESPGPQNDALCKSTQDAVDSTPVKDVSKCLEADEKENELPAPTEEHPAEDTVWSNLSPDTTVAQRTQETEDTVKNEKHQIVSEVVPTQTVENKEKRKKNRSKRKSNEKQRKSSVIKVDFPPQMVRAHQAAYGFLTPNISKYETLTDLLDQAAQTQLSLQPMMSALVMRFEEVNQALEEIADEGEQMLKEHGDYMALPSGMKGPAVMSVKPSGDPLSSNDPPPDLLQLMLQQATEKMRLVGGSAQALGDATLKEAVEYFSLLSKLLFEKLQAKQAAERRLTQVLAWVEGAAMKSNPEDLALHSEDSGIGGENESLTGSERHHHHRGSAGSGSSASGANMRVAHESLANNLLNLIGSNEDDEEEDDNESDGEFEDDQDDRPGRKRSNSSPPDPSQPHLYTQGSYMQDVQPTVRRPLTALSAKPENSSPVIIMDLQRSQKDLDQRLKKRAEIQENPGLSTPQYNRHRAGPRRHSLCGSAGERKARLKANQSPCPLPALAPQPPKQQSVRRLINAFSQGVDGRPGQSLANIPPHIRRCKKSEILLLSDTGGLVINGNNNNNSWPDGRDDLDEESLPPPPPEVLMDISFQSTDGTPGNYDGLQEHPGRSLPIIAQKTAITHRLKTSLQNVDVLPNRASMRPRPISISPSHPVRQDAVAGAQVEEQQTENYLDPETENALYQQARKIIHLRNAAEYSAKRNLAELGGRGHLPLQAKMGQSNDFTEGEMPSCLPVTAPPVSRVRLPPSCPTVRHRFPSPPVLRPQSSSRPSSRPSSPKTVVHASDSNTEEIVPSVSFQDARSVFCQHDFKNYQTCISSELPRQWGEVSRGRIPTRGRGTPTHRTQSEQRSGLSSHSECFRESASRISEPVTTKYRPTSPLMRRDNAQPRASASEAPA